MLNPTVARGGMHTLRELHFSIDARRHYVMTSQNLLPHPLQNAPPVFLAPRVLQKFAAAGEDACPEMMDTAGWLWLSRAISSPGAGELCMG